MRNHIRSGSGFQGPGRGRNGRVSGPDWKEPGPRLRIRFRDDQRCAGAAGQGL